MLNAKYLLTATVYFLAVYASPPLHKHFNAMTIEDDYKLRLARLGPLETYKLSCSPTADKSSAELLKKLGDVTWSKEGEKVSLAIIIYSISTNSSAVGLHAGPQSGRCSVA
jgi:hypothetical protein